MTNHIAYFLKKTSPHKGKRPEELIAPAQSFTCSVPDIVVIEKSTKAERAEMSRRRCSGLLHYKPRNTNLWQYPLAVSSISCAPRKREEVSVGWRETVY